MLQVVLAGIAGYLAGSIPFGLVISRIGGAGDIRSIGSGNIGATNVLRTGRKGLAALTLIADLLKGWAPTFVALHALGPVAAIAVGLGAALGHCFSIWLGFRGGKAVATAAGVVLALSPAAFSATLITFAATVALTKMVSPASLAAAIAAPIAALALQRPELAIGFAAMAALIVERHRANIGRLLRGEEPKIGKRT